MNLVEQLFPTSHVILNDLVDGALGQEGRRVTKHGTTGRALPAVFQGLAPSV